MSDWPFSPEHDELPSSIRAFVTTELAPHADEWEASGDFPDEVFGRLGELGFLGLAYPEEYGGGGGDYLCQIVLAEEMARCRSGGVALAIAVQTDMTVPPILKFGTEEQRKKYLVPALTGRRSSASASPTRTRAVTSRRSKPLRSGPTAASSSTDGRPSSRTVAAPMP